MNSLALRIQVSKSAFRETLQNTHGQKFATAASDVSNLAKSNSPLNNIALLNMTGKVVLSSVVIGISVRGLTIISDVKRSGFGSNNFLSFEISDGPVPQHPPIKTAPNSFHRCTVRKLQTESLSK